MYGVYEELSEVYNETKEMLAEQLEAEFATYYTFGNVEKAYETLGKLMYYSLISRDDSRLNEKGTFLKNVVKSKVAELDHRFEYDLRSGVKSLGQWMYCRVPKNVKYELLSDGYVTNSNYEYGEITLDIPERGHILNIILDTTSKQAENSIEMISNTYKKEYGRTPINEDDIQLARAGILRTFRIEFETLTESANKTLGHIVMFPMDDKIQATIIIKNDILKKLNIDITSAYKGAEQAMYSAGIPNVISFMSYCKLGKHISEQYKIKEEQLKLKAEQEKLRLEKDILDKQVALKKMEKEARAKLKKQEN